jgi:hypothetical protein
LGFGVGESQRTTRVVMQIKKAAAIVNLIFLS